MIQLHGVCAIIMIIRFFFFFSIALFSFIFLIWREQTQRHRSFLIFFLCSIVINWNGARSQWVISSAFFFFIYMFYFYEISSQFQWKVFFRLFVVVPRVHTFAFSCFLFFGFIFGLSIFLTFKLFHNLLT